MILERALGPHCRLLLGILLSGVVACAPAGSKRLVVDSHSLGREYLAAEIGGILSDAGYNRLQTQQDVFDTHGREAPSVDRKQGSIFNTRTHLLMYFRSRESETRLVDVRVNKTSGVVELTFHDKGSAALSPASERGFREVEEQLILKHGRDRVRVR